MGKNACPVCESASGVKEKGVSIKIGKEQFKTRTLVCADCGHYALTKEVRAQMDQWGRQLRKAIVEPQPLFSETAYEYLEELAQKYGLKKVPLIKAMLSFYLNRVVDRSDFSEIKNILEKKGKEAFDLIRKGKRSKMSVPVQYMTFRKLEIFSDVWDVTHARAIEEAVEFGIALLTYRDIRGLREIARRFEEFIEDYAAAA